LLSSGTSLLAGIFSLGMIGLLCQGIFILKP
jgi:hypothetical protein